MEQRQPAQLKALDDILYLFGVPAAFVLAALLSFVFSKYVLGGVLLVLAVIAFFIMTYVLGPKPFNRSKTIPPSLLPRYKEAQNEFIDKVTKFTFTRPPRGRQWARGIVQYVEEQAAGKVDLSAQEARGIASSIASNNQYISASSDRNAFEDAVVEFLLVPHKALQESIRQVPWQVDTIRTSKGAAIVTWRPASSDNVTAMREQANTTSQHLIAKMTEVLMAHPDVDLAKYATHFGVEVKEVERTWNQQADPVEAIFKQLATSATSLVQLEIQLEGVLKKYNVDPDSEVGLNIQGIYRAAAARFADPNSQ